MISELFILKLQIAAAGLMGYEFFISEDFKKVIDMWAKEKTKDLHAKSIEEIKVQINVIKKNIPYYISASIFLGIGAFSFFLMNYFETKLDFVWGALILFFPTLFFIIGAFNTVLDKLFKDGLAPLVLPLGKWFLSFYLLFTAKGVISGAGFLILVASFICRYHNLTDA